MKLDDTLDGIRKNTPGPETTRAAAEAVAARLGLDHAESAVAKERIEGCEGFRARIPDLVAGRLSAAEALLVHDHTRECVPCRRALIAARVGADTAPPAARNLPASRWPRWVGTAAAVVVLALAGYGLNRFVGNTPRDLSVAATDGGLWRLEDGTASLLAAGTVVPENDTLRTERGGGAVLTMADGSRIEMRESTQLTVARRRDGATIRLAQGSIIVEASKQGSGHLDVATGDALVTVKGTIFSVNAGLAGSRVAVLEGAVRVRAAGEEKLLSPGDQAASRPGLAAVPLHESFAWSRDAARYDGLVAELRALRHDLDAGVGLPPARHATTLLDRVPEGTVLYVAVPNLTGALTDAARIFKEHLDRSEALRAWWNESHGSADAEREMGLAFAKLHALGNEIGDELVAALALDANGNIGAPVVLAEVRSPDSFRAVAEREGLTKVQDLELRFDGDLVVAGKRGSLPRALSGKSSFATTPFHQRLAEAYGDGTGFLFGADVETILARGTRAGRDTKGLAALGADGVRHVIVERTEAEATAHTQATLIFNGPRHGVASWLASPGPMGGLDFVSPDANFVASVLMKEPGAAVRELFATIGGDDAGFAKALDEFRDKSGVDPAADLADPLGGELTVALDGPVLPTPAWKLVVEVYDPARLQNSIATLVDRLDAEMRSHGRPESATLETTTEDGRTWHTLRATPEHGSVLEAHYTFDHGYLVAAPSRELVRLALATRANGTNITASSRFRALLPQDRRADFSAIVFEHVAPILEPLAKAAGPAGGDAKSLAALAGGDRGHLFYAYAGDDRIEIAGDTTGGLGSDLASLFEIMGARAPRSTPNP